MDTSVSYAATPPHIHTTPSTPSALLLPLVKSTPPRQPRCQAVALSETYSRIVMRFDVGSLSLAARFRGQIPSKLGPLFRPSNALPLLRQAPTTPSRVACHPSSGRRGMIYFSPHFQGGVARSDGVVTAAWRNKIKGEPTGSPLPSRLLLSSGQAMSLD